MLAEPPHEKIGPEEGHAGDRRASEEAAPGESSEDADLFHPEDQSTGIPDLRPLLQTPVEPQEKAEGAHPLAVPGLAQAAAGSGTGSAPSADPPAAVEGGAAAASAVPGMASYLYLDNRIRNAVAGGPQMGKIVHGIFWSG